MNHELKQYVVDAFADRPFSGNAAAVVPLKSWLRDDLLQAIAAQNNLSETAFFVPVPSDTPGDASSFTNVPRYQIRWFTPAVEVDLCGHATLASAFVLNLEHAVEHCIFESRSGDLEVRLDESWWQMDFPAEVAEQAELPAALAQAFAVEQEAPCLFNQDYLLILESEATVVNAKPDFSALLELEGRGVIITAASERYDFVHRFFGPKVGIDEDPVTGSAFTKLIPYWARKLGKQTMTGKQVSKRGGVAKCQFLGERVTIAGQARLFASGTIYV